MATQEQALNHTKALATTPLQKSNKRRAATTAVTTATAAIAAKTRTKSISYFYIRILADDIKTRCLITTSFEIL